MVILMSEILSLLTPTSMISGYATNASQRIEFLGSSRPPSRFRLLVQQCCDYAPLQRKAELRELKEEIKL